MKLVTRDGQPASFGMDDVEYVTDENGVIEVPEAVGQHILSFPVFGFEHSVDQDAEWTYGESEPDAERIEPEPEPEPTVVPEQDTLPPVKFQIDGTVEEPEEPLQEESDEQSEEPTEGEAEEAPKPSRRRGAKA